MFDLSDSGSWDATRAQITEAVDLAAEIGGCTYFTPGRRDGRSFDELTASLAEAVAPCAAYAASRGVRLAIEPSLRTDVSFVHTLRDGLDVAEVAGIDVIADLGNCWTERDYEKTVRRADGRIAVVQFADAVFGTPKEPPPGGRAVLRVEATGLCHSDVDHFRGIVHTSWGGEFPSIAGHEIVGRIEKITPEAAAAWGVEAGDRVAVRGIVITPDGNYRIYGHDF